MISLEMIVVVLAQHEIDVVDMDHYESLMQMMAMPSSKWHVELVNLPPRVWISIDDRVEFTNYDGLCEYNDELQREEQRREDQRDDLPLQPKRAQFWQTRYRSQLGLDPSSSLAREYVEVGGVGIEVSALGAHGVARETPRAKHG